MINLLHKCNKTDASDIIFQNAKGFTIDLLDYLGSQAQVYYCSNKLTYFNPQYNSELRFNGSSVYSQKYAVK